jgi:deoxyribose-phosphate aldolase
MYIEYACYNYALSDEELKHNFTLAIKLGIKNIATFHMHLPAIKALTEELSLNISCPIDYPYGMSDSKTRSTAINAAAKAGATCVDIMVPAKFISNRKYDKLRDDIKNNLTICQENNLVARYILEYRVFNHETLAKTCQILKTLGIEYIFPASGHMIDDINDNLIAAKYLMAKSDIKVITNGNIWTAKHSDNIKLADIYGIRLHHVPSLELFLKNNSY